MVRRLPRRTVKYRRTAVPPSALERRFARAPTGGRDLCVLQRQAQAAGSPRAEQPRLPAALQRDAGDHHHVTRRRGPRRCDARVRGSRSRFLAHGGAVLPRARDHQSCAGDNSEPGRSGRGLQRPRTRDCAEPPPATGQRGVAPPPVGRGLVPRGHAEDRQHFADVPLHASEADTQFGRDFRVRLPPGDEVQHFALARRPRGVLAFWI